MAGWMSNCGCSEIRSAVSWPVKKQIFLWFYKWEIECRPSITKSECAKHSKTGKFEIQTN
jgi:hypothetical protein